MRYKEKEYKYAVYRKHGRTDGFALNSKHMTKAAAETKQKSAKSRWGRAFIKKL